LPPIDLIDGRSHAVRKLGIALALLIFSGLPADAGVFSRFWDKQQESMFSRKNRPHQEEVPGGRPPNLVTTNGVEVPAWASKRIRESPVPLYGKSWGRRPWAMALSNQATPSAAWARADQLGYGAGPVPGYTNDYAGAGNYPMASVGNTTVNGWGPSWGIRRMFMPSNYPIQVETGATGH
jgi:hypothetical protein